VHGVSQRNTFRIHMSLNIILIFMVVILKEVYETYHLIKGYKCC